jgi:hypothetical protein
VRQRIQPTSTNLPCGLTIFSPPRFPKGIVERALRPERDTQAQMSALHSSFLPFCWQIILPGDYGAGEPPVPIPNTEVKPCRADGTAA